MTGGALRQRVLYLGCFGLMALGALWRVASWLLPIDPARGYPWFLMLGDPVPPMLYMFIPRFIGALCFLVVVFLVLKRVLIFLREGALEVPGSFTPVPSTLAGIGLAATVLVEMFDAVPGVGRWIGSIEIWLINLVLLVLPVSFYLTEIRGLAASVVNASHVPTPPDGSAPRTSTTRRVPMPGAGRAAKGIEPSPPKWSWLVYAAIWFGVCVILLHRFGGVKLLDSTLPLAERLVAFGVAAIPGGLVTALIKIYVDPIFIGVAEKRSKIDMAEELLDSVALTAVGVAAEGALGAVTGAASGGSSEDGGFSGGGGSSGGGGASGSI